MNRNATESPLSLKEVKTSGHFRILPDLKIYIYISVYDIQYLSYFGNCQIIKERKKTYIMVKISYFTLFGQKI